MVEQKKKKEGKKKEIKKEQKLKSSRSLNQIKILLIILILIIILLILAFVFKEQIQEKWIEISGQRFTYHNITYTKIYVSKIPMYVTKLTLKRSDGYKTYDLYFRNDPRELAKIPSTIEDIPKKDVFVSFSPEIFKCEKSTLAAWKLGEFLGMLEYNVSGAITNATGVEDVNLSAPDNVVKVRDCGYSHGDISVIVLQPADKTSIHMDEIYIKCFIIDVADCDVVKASERFILSILDIKMGFTKPSDFY